MIFQSSEEYKDLQVVKNTKNFQSGENANDF